MIGMITASARHRWTYRRRNGTKRKFINDFYARACAQGGPDSGHYHEDGHCGLVAEEAVSLNLPDVSSTFADLALFWTKFADMKVYCDQLDRLIERLGVKTIAPTHGLPITDVKATVPKVQEGLKAAALMPESGTNEKLPLNSAVASVA